MEPTTPFREEKSLKVKKHKKHKSDRKERHEERYASPNPVSSIEKPSLKLILNLKMGGSSTPEHHSDSPAAPPIPTTSNTPSETSQIPPVENEESQNSFVTEKTSDSSKHKKSKKKKKKKERDRKEKKHKHQHKERSRKRERDESSQDDVSGVEENVTGEVTQVQPPIKKLHIYTEDTRTHQEPKQESTEPTSPSREPRTCVLRQRQGKHILQKLLDYLLKGLEKKDQQQFFAWPVTDNIAPGYSQIITQPMDFSTIKLKIDKQEYDTLDEFMSDIRLMCTNAMVYNHAETIYYKSANKLLHFANRMTTPDKLRALQNILPYMSELTVDELGFELIEEESIIISEGGVRVDDLDDDDIVVVGGDKGKDNDGGELSSDDMGAEFILNEARKRAEEAAEELARRRPNSKFGFLRQRKDGTTSLAILNPGSGVTPGTMERPVSLGLLIGKLNHGTGQIQGYREDRRNIAKPIKPLYYGAFGSYAPSYDSTFANLSKEESDLVYQTYGNETGFQYAESIMEFAKDCDYAMHVVDELLDILTGGEHRKTLTYVQDRKKLKEEEEAAQQALANAEKMIDEPAVTIDVNALRSLSDLGIDTSFIDDYEKEVSSTVDPKTDPVQIKLDNTAALLDQLEQVQKERLCAPPPTHLSHAPQASQEEITLAHKVGETLADMVKQVTPNEIIGIPAIRKAMGITTVPITTTAVASQPITTNQQTTTTEQPVTITVEEQPETTEEQPAEETPMESDEPKDPPVSVQQPESQESIEVDVEGADEVTAGLTADLESELREFLENDPTLSNSPIADDATLEEMLCDP